MLRSEFIERTGYEPVEGEYRYIEDSYYEFDGNKDEFCKQWLKDKRSGAWNKELRLRKQVDEIKEEMQAKLDEMEDNLTWYREQFAELQKYKNMVRGIRNIVA